MKKQLAFAFSIFSSAVFAGSPAFAQAVAPVPGQLPAAQQPVANIPGLTLSDLPSGFQELPPEIKGQVAARIEPFKQALAKQNLPLSNFFAFVQPEKMEVVMGFTGILPNQVEQAKFDTALLEFQQPQFQQQVTKLSQIVQRYGVQSVTYKVIPDIQNLADTSTGLSLMANIQQTPTQFDIVGFRRGNFGAFTAVFHLSGKQPSISVKDVATTLDGRVLQSSSASNSIKTAN